MCPSITTSFIPHFSCACLLTASLPAGNHTLKINSCQLNRYSTKNSKLVHSSSSASSLINSRRTGLFPSPRHYFFLKFLNSPPVSKTPPFEHPNFLLPHCPKQSPFPFFTPGNMQGPPCDVGPHGSWGGRSAGVSVWLGTASTGLIIGHLSDFANLQHLPFVYNLSQHIPLYPGNNLEARAE